MQMMSNQLRAAQAAAQRPPANMQAMASQLQQNRSGPAQMPMVPPMQGQMPQGQSSQTQMMDQMQRMQKMQQQMQQMQQMQAPSGRPAPAAGQMQQRPADMQRMMADFQARNPQGSGMTGPAMGGIGAMQRPPSSGMTQTGIAAGMGAGKLAGAAGVMMRAGNPAGAAAPAKLAKGGMAKPKPKATTKTKPKAVTKPKTVAKRVVAKPKKAVVKRTVTKKRG
jgi:hypothetical protein